MQRFFIIFLSLLAFTKTAQLQELPLEYEIRKIESIEGDTLLEEVLLLYDSLTRINDYQIKITIAKRIFDITKEKDELVHSISLASSVRFAVSDDFSLFDKAYNIAERYENTDLMIYFDEWQVDCYLEHGIYDKAMTYLLRLLDLSKELQLDESYRNALNVLGDIYYSATLMPQAKASYVELLQYYSDNNEWNFWRPYMLMNNLGQIALYNKDTSAAYYWFRKSFETADTSLIQPYRYNTLAYTKLKLAEILRIKGEYNKSLALIEEVERYPVGSVFEDVMQEFYYQKAMLFLEMKQFNKALRMTDKLYPSDHFVLTDYRFVPEVYKVLADIYYGKRQYRNALKNLQNYTYLSDSIEKQGNIARSIILLTNKNHEELREENRMEKQRMELEQQRMILINDAEQKKQRVVLYSLLGGAILLIIIILVVLRNNLQRRKDNRKLNLQKQMVQDYARELRTANVTKDKFFSIIAHDLKGPIGTLNNLIQLLVDNYDEIDEDERVRMLQSVLKSSNNTYSLLMNLLEWSRSQQGKVKLNPRSFNVSQSIENVYQLIMDSASQKKQNIKMEVPADLEITTDKSMFETIIRNLLSNSIKFTTVGGDIFVGAKNDNTDIIISVKDNGIGMSEEMTKVLFDISSDIQRKGTDREIGTGLGLILCKEFIEKMGGTISVSSEEGKGSEFTISLPVNE